MEIYDVIHLFYVNIRHRLAGESIKNIPQMHLWLKSPGRERHANHHIWSSSAARKAAILAPRAPSRVASMSGKAPHNRSMDIKADQKKSY